MTIQATCLLTIFLSCVSLAQATLASGMGSSFPSTKGTFEIKVAGYEGEQEFLWKYRLDLRNLRVDRTSTEKGASPQSKHSESFATLLREKDLRDETRRKALRDFDTSKIPNAKWISISPNGKFWLVGFEDRKFDLLRSVAVIDAITSKRIRELTYVSSKFILDVEWAADSGMLTVLYANQRFGWSPASILRFLLGHGMPLNSISVDLLNVRSGEIHQISIVEDVSYGDAIITKPQNEK